jgi:hypothetical protein
MGRPLSDRTFATLVGAGLFVLVGWPLAFLTLPPYQDVPGHVATTVILLHPEKWPEFAPTGLLKTNSAMYAFGVLLAPIASAVTSARVFIALTLLANALALPHVLLYFRGKKALVASLPFLPPMVHHWFFSMGMVNFSMALPLSFLLVAGLHAQEKAPTLRRGLGLAALAFAVWFCHSLPVMVVGLLIVARVVFAPSMHDRAARARALVPPLAPAGLVVVVGALRHVFVKFEPFGELHPTGYSSFPWLLYDMWAHYLYGFTEWTLTSLPLGLLLAALALRTPRDADLGLLSAPAWGLVTAAYFIAPFTAFDWAMLGPRFLPFFWLCALLRIPEKLPRSLFTASAVGAALFVVGLNVDVFRVARDQDEYLAGLPAVPKGARLLPLTFSTRRVSKNVWSLANASSLYAVYRETNAHDVWATNPSMPIVRTKRVKPRFDRHALLRFMAWAPNPKTVCEEEASHGVFPADCQPIFDSAWRDFWRDAREDYTHVLMWAAPADVVATVPPGMRETLHQGDLRIFEVVR